MKKKNDEKNERAGDGNDDEQNVDRTVECATNSRTQNHQMVLTYTHTLQAPEKKIIYILCVLTFDTCFELHEVANIL